MLFQNARLLHAFSNAAEDSISNICTNKWGTCLIYHACTIYSQLSLRNPGIEKIFLKINIIANQSIKVYSMSTSW